jgi:hypothetical protein
MSRCVQIILMHKEQCLIQVSHVHTHIRTCELMAYEGMPTYTHELID